MTLLPPELRAKIPKISAQGNNPDPIVYAKFTTGDGSWKWYFTEGEENTAGNDFVFYGYAMGFEEDWGYFDFSELVSICEEAELLLTHDANFEPAPFSEVLRREGLGEMA